MAKAQKRRRLFAAAVAAQPINENALRVVEAASGHGEVAFGPFDVVILIALNEEFRSVRDLLPFPLHGKGIPAQGVASTEFRFSLPVATGQTHTCLLSVLGDMGEVEAALATQSLLLRKHPPKLIANIGISGGTDSDVKLGDVIVSQSVHRYLADSKTVDSKSAGKKLADDGKGESDTKAQDLSSEWSASAGVQFHLAPRTYDNRIDIALFAGNFATRDSSRFRAWQRQGGKDLANKVSVLERAATGTTSGEAKQLKALLDSEKVGEKPSVHRGPIGSGPGVGGSKQLLKLIRDNNRKFLAIDMESGGFMAALRRSLCRPPEIILRGVSDFADERKTELDQTTGGAIREIAMRNAFRLFLNLLDDDLLGLIERTEKTAGDGPAVPGQDA